MENANEIVLITNKQFTAFKKAYTTLTTNTMKLARMASELADVDEKSFKEYCESELAMNRTTVAKLITSGKILLAMDENNLITKNYSQVYELNPVREVMADYVEYLGDKAETFEDMTIKETRESVKNFLHTDDAEGEGEGEDEGEGEGEGEDEEITNRELLLEAVALLEGLKVSAKDSALKAEIIATIMGVANNL